MSSTTNILGRGFLSTLLLVIASAHSEEKTDFNSSAKPIPAGSKIQIAPIPGGFENYIAAGISKMKIPVVLVNAMPAPSCEGTDPIKLDFEHPCKLGDPCDLDICISRSGRDHPKTLNFVSNRPFTVSLAPADPQPFGDETLRSKEGPPAFHHVNTGEARPQAEGHSFKYTATAQDGSGKKIDPHIIIGP